MADGSFFAWITSAAPPMYALALGAAVLVVRFYPLWKQRWTEARTAQDAITGNQWKRFQDEIARLDGRCEGLEDKVRECEAREQKWMERVAEAEDRASRAEAKAARLEAINQGRGEVRQEVTLLDSEAQLGQRGSRPRNAE